MPIVNHSLKYNPSIDGVRGISILFVILFHLWPKTFTYGYLGVDLFFLLSGFLITKIIYTKLESNLFSFKEFYRNRIRRIFPSVIIVLLFTILIGYLFLFPSELKNLSNHIKSTAFFYQNFRLIGEVGYWDDSAQLKPLLHFWSLSIEEQFYIFWPLLIFVIYKFKLNLFNSLFILLLISLMSSYIFEIDKFYHSLSRFWELVLGGLIYSISRNYTVPITKNNKFLSFYPLVFLGLISFPLYLWHYVFISYSHILGIDVEKYAFFIIFITLVFSYLKYIYVEIYTRKQDSYIFSTILLIILTMIGFSGKYIYKYDGLITRTHLISNENYKEQFIRTSAKNKEGISLVEKVLGYKVLNDYVKSTSDDLLKKFVVLIGDSHAHTSYLGFAEELKKNGYETVLIANSSCPPYLNGASGISDKEISTCKVKIKSIYEFVNKMSNVKKIIFVTRGPAMMYDIGFGIIDGGDKPYNLKFENYEKSNNHKSNFKNAVNETFTYFNKKSEDFYYLIENPELGFSPKNCMLRPFELFPINCKISKDIYIKRASEYRSLIYNLKKVNKKINVLDPIDLYCDNSFCYAIIDNKMLYSDDDHHSKDGSKMQARYFIEEILFEVNRNENDK